MRLAIRPIRYTAQLGHMQAWAAALGMVTLTESPSWVVLAAGAGRLALHAVPPDHQAAGTTALAVETDDLDALDAHWRQVGMSTRLVDDDGVPLLYATTDLGGDITAGELSPSSVEPPDADLTVAPMLSTSQVEAAARWFASWGLRRRISSDGGGWVDLEVPDGGGLAAIHLTEGLSNDPPPPTAQGEIAVGLSFEHRDVDALRDRLHTAGLTDAHVVDESYNRTLLVRCPDGDQIWVNGQMTDLYGYRRSV